MGVAVLRASFCGQSVAADDICSLECETQQYTTTTHYPVIHNSNLRSVSIFILGGYIHFSLTSMPRCPNGTTHSRTPTEIFPAFLMNGVHVIYPISFLLIALFGEDHKMLFCLLFVQSVCLLALTYGDE